MRRCVGVVHRFAVGTPCEPIADHHAAHDLGERAIRIQSVQRAAARVALLVHAAREKTTAWVAAAVVEAMPRRVVWRRDDLALENAIRRCGPNAAAQRDN